MRLIGTPPRRTVRVAGTRSEGENVAGIGVVGAGVSSLHLGLYLRAHDVPVTIYADKTARADRRRAPAEHGRAPPPHPRARARPRRAPWGRRRARLRLPPPLHLGADLAFQGTSTTRRCASTTASPPPPHGRLRGARRRPVVGPTLEAADVEALRRPRPHGRRARSREHRRHVPPPARPVPVRRPQRRLCAGLYHGVAPTEPGGVSFCIAPATASCSSSRCSRARATRPRCSSRTSPAARPSGSFDMSVEEDVAGFEQAVLETVRQHYAGSPFHHPSSFWLLGPSGRPAGRAHPRSSARTTRSCRPGSSRPADTHVVAYPIIGQGANSASYSAWMVGEAIVTDLVL